MIFETSRRTALNTEDGIVALRCLSCSESHLYPRGFCPHCGSDRLEARPLSGAGTVAAVTILHRAPTEAYKSKIPYAVTVVDLDEGLRVMGHGDRDLEPKQRVSVDITQDEEAPLRFRRVEEATR